MKNESTEDNMVEILETIYSQSVIISVWINLVAIWRNNVQNGQSRNVKIFGEYPSPGRRISVVNPTAIIIPSTCGDGAKKIGEEEFLTLKKYSKTGDKEEIMFPPDLGYFLCGSPQINMSNCSSNSLMNISSRCCKFYGSSTGEAPLITTGLEDPNQFPDCLASGFAVPSMPAASDHTAGSISSSTLQEFKDIYVRHGLVNYNAHFFRAQIGL
ncbi:hypothetical protein B0H17DRAFT_1147113, partial [Mycena rosella]